MTVETINNGIEDLDDTLPAGTDPKSEGDNHIRNTKLALGLSFPNSAGAWNTTSEIQASGFNAKDVKIRNVGTPVDATDAAQKGQIDALDVRVTSNDDDITALEQNDAVQDAALTDHETRITDLEAAASKFTSYGYIDATGAITGGSGDFSVNKLGTGEYELVFNEAATAQFNQSMNVNTVGVPPFSLARTIDVAAVSATNWGVYTYNANNGNPIDAGFTFTRQAN